MTRLFSQLFWLLIAQIYGKNISQFIGMMSVSDIMEGLYGKIGKDG
ncbi:MAG: hypothetical protein ACRY3E_00515 [Candidatus Lariskella arthropodorum]